MIFRRRVVLALHGLSVGRRPGPSRMLQRIVDAGIGGGDSVVYNRPDHDGPDPGERQRHRGHHRFAVRVSQSMGADYRRELFSRSALLSARNLDQWQTGNSSPSVVRRAAGDAIHLFTGRMFLRVPFVAIGALTMMVLTDWLSLIMLYPARGDGHLSLVRQPGTEHVHRFRTSSPT